MNRNKQGQEYGGKHAEAIAEAERQEWLDAVAARVMATLVEWEEDGFRRAAELAYIAADTLWDERERRRK